MNRITGLLAAALVLAAVPGALAVELNKAAVEYKLPAQIEWKENAASGNAQAIVHGDPTKPGLYVVLLRWKAGNHFSKPHFHPNDRFITVLQGTWWVGTGNKWDKDATVPMPAGSFVVHYGKQVHYDGAKDEDAVLQIVGDGPATSTPAPEKN